MTTNKMLELLILTRICDEYWKDDSYAMYLNEHYHMDKLGDRYNELGIEFLNEYALNKTEKSEENL